MHPSSLGNRRSVGQTDRAGSPCRVHVSSGYRTPARILIICRDLMRELTETGIPGRRQTCQGVQTGRAQQAISATGELSCPLAPSWPKIYGYGRPFRTGQ